MSQPISFPISTQKRFAHELNEAVLRVDFLNYGNEPNFSPAMVQQLREFKYEDENLSVRFEGVVVPAVGRGSTEKWLGADFSLVSIISQAGKEDVRKANLFQSKIGRVERLSPKERDRLIEQIKDMRAFTPHPKVLEVSRSKELPTVVSGVGLLEERRLQHATFGDWVAKRVLPTFDGDTTPFLVNAVLQANLTSLRMFARKK
jgi:hypothetical protein